MGYRKTTAPESVAVDQVPPISPTGGASSGPDRRLLRLPRQAENLAAIVEELRGPRRGRGRTMNDLGRLNDRVAPNDESHRDRRGDRERTKPATLATTSALQPRGAIGAPRRRALERYAGAADRSTTATIVRSQRRRMPSARPKRRQITIGHRTIDTRRARRFLSVWTMWSTRATISRVCGRESVPTPRRCR